MENVLGPAGVAAFRSRSIDPATAIGLGVYTGRRVSEAGEVVPDPNGVVVCFPTVRGGKVVNIKYRAPGKKFWQLKGGEKAFYGVEVLNSPLVETGNPVVITEGELDLLTAVDCGWELAMSVPDGAPPVSNGQGREAFDPSEDRSGKFEFMFHARDQLKRVKRFILAVDNDGPGQRLAEELVRRLGAWRCSFVTYPEGCKDLNDVVQKHGPDAVVSTLLNAKPYPTRGLYRVSDYPETGDLVTFRTGFDDMDEHLRLFLGELMVVTGIPGHGKSTWLVNLCVNLARLHDWKIAIASFEIPVKPMLRHKLRLATAGDPKQWDRELIDGWDAWIEDHFTLITAPPSIDAEADQMDLDWLLDKAEIAVVRDDIRVLLIDPWNELEHARPRDMTETQYINHALRLLRHFAQRHQLIVIIAAHPTKSIVKEDRPPSLYDIEGSGAWANKPDHGISVHVPERGVLETVIFIDKVRFADSGKKGDVTYRFEKADESYHSLNGMNPIWKQMQANKAASKPAARS